MQLAGYLPVDTNSEERAKTPVVVMSVGGAKIRQEYYWHNRVDRPWTLKRLQSVSADLNEQSLQH